MQSIHYARFIRPLILSLWLLLTSCSQPYTLFDDTVRELGYKRIIHEGKLSPQLILVKGDIEDTSILHVYLDGDGHPWRRRTVISHDPTPRDYTVLELMQIDPNPAIYLGRPCYNGYSQTGGCTPKFWTAGRYSFEVVNDMTMALEHLIQTHGVDKMLLFGYSGGGVLAMLIGAKLDETAAIVTIAANLDTESWTSLHDYSPLETSLNPAHLEPLPSTVYQLHLMGSDDVVVPPAVSHHVVTRQNADFRVVSGYTHNCCYDAIWLEIVQQVHAALSIGQLSK